MDNSKCWMKNDCDCSHCDGFCLKHKKLNYLYNYANLTINKRHHIKLFLDADKTDYDEFVKLKEIETNIVDFIDSGNSLYLHSTQCGNGKSSWAIRMIQSYFNSIWEYCNFECKAIFIHVPTFLIELKNNIKNKSEYIQDILDNYLTADLIVWDDIGTKTASPYESEYLLTLIEGRIMRGKANIFTSNLTDEETKTVLGDRLTSRIVHSTYNITLNGGDKRGL